MMSWGSTSTGIADPKSFAFVRSEVSVAILSVVVSALLEENDDVHGVFHVGENPLVTDRVDNAIRTARGLEIRML